MLEQKPRQLNALQVKQMLDGRLRRAMKISHTTVFFLLMNDMTFGFFYINGVYNSL
jgi:hypothetical protein